MDNEIEFLVQSILGLKCDDKRMAKLEKISWDALAELISYRYTNKPVGLMHKFHLGFITLTVLNGFF